MPRQSGVSTLLHILALYYAVEWGVDLPSSACPRALLTQQTFEVLTLGTLQTDGTMLFRGSHYRVLATALTGGAVLCSAVSP